MRDNGHEPCAVIETSPAKSSGLGSGQQGAAATQASIAAGSC